MSMHICKKRTKKQRHDSSNINIQKFGVFIFFFLRNKCFKQARMQECTKLMSKDIDNVRRFLFQTNAVILNLSIKEKNIFNIGL